MTTDQLTQYMQAPGLLDRQTLPQLQELTERYPAFETGWMLFLRNLKNLGDTSFEQELVNGAIRIQNRRKLYLFLHDPEPDTEPALPMSPVQNKEEILNLIFPSGYRLEGTPPMEESLEETAPAIQNKASKGVRLIDKFLEAQPKMPQIKDKEPASPMESALVQDASSEDFVTETLASIYAQQGYYKKAVQIFEKLSLKYPEKSTYFAEQIEKIKHLMNN